MQIIREALKKNVALSVWLLETFSNQDLIKEFLIDCPIPDMKRFVGGLLKTAMNTVYKHEEQALREYIQSLETDPLEYIVKTQGANVKQMRKVDMKIQSTKGAPDTPHSSQGCQNLNVVTLGHHNERLPVLILMINSFIHLSVSKHYFDYSRLSG
jgi:hypothetical protein